MQQRVKFKKYFNRHLPLFAVEYWYKSEADILYKLTDGKICFNPLFIQNKSKGVEVYYDINTDTKPMIDYFADNPAEFTKISDKYKKDCNELEKIITKNKKDNIEVIFNKIANDIFPVTSIIMSLGKVKRDGVFTKQAFAALSLRESTDKILYDVGDALYYLIVKKYPKYKNYADFLKIEEVLSGELPKVDELKKRERHFIYFDGNLFTEMSIGELEKQNNVEIIKESIEDWNKFKGDIAQKGKVKGVVKIMFTIHDIKKISDGDVVVTPMTTPDFMPAMKKASAFITDEGGVTCHASIIAREMKKPCIIGTKIATELLKDGDVVEVDANNGVVRIIKKAG
jgi:phosphohistidine swiveling domain-containing protein